MRPLKLEFEGINSFSEHTIIDFEKLTKNGVFGIFGDTGSGKSTILDCINFALYGRVERSKEKTDIINYRSQAAKVKFEFDMLNLGQRKKYLVERTLKKDKAGTHKASLYEDGACIAEKPQEVEKKVIEILGLEAEDFRKCIALPQGEFAQFVKSTPSERLALIQRLFSLSVYGDRLKEKIAQRQNAAELEYNKIFGALSAYSDVTSEAIAAAADDKTRALSELKISEDKAKKAKSVCDELSDLFKKRRELDGVKAELENLSSRKKEMEELRKNLAILPACREAVAAKGELDREIALQNAKNEQLFGLSKQLKDAEEQIKNLEKERASCDYDGKISDAMSLLARYETCQGKPQKLAEAENQLNKKREEYKKAAEERGELLKSKDIASSELARLKENEKNLGGGDILSLLGDKFKGAVLKEQYVAELCYFTDLKAGIEIYRQNSPLFEYVDGEVRRRIEEYKQRVLDVKDFSLNSVEVQIEAVERAQKKREELSKKLVEATNKLNVLEGDIKLKENEISTLSADGATLRKRADELKAELDGVFGENCKDYSAAERDLRGLIENLRKRNTELVERLEFARKAKSDTEIKIAGVRTEAEGAARQISEKEEKLKKLLDSAKLTDFDECKKLANSFSEYPDAEKSLSDFDTEVSANNKRLKELLKIDGIERINDGEVKRAEEESSAAEKAVVEINRQVAVAEENFKKLSTRMDEKQKLEKEFKGVEKERELISKLKEATKNNKFLEYVANEYLYDISALATSTLLKLTDGRYFLTYNDNNFCVGDNFDCGNLRGVNTLSGGETFLVSLSLALALSRTICAKSLKSIEFFFLDEGFGTLDNSLVDVVMSALEKLKSSAFTIGVISHVEELKHRIEYQITVNKATESHGSTVRLSC